MTKRLKLVFFTGNAGGDYLALKRARSEGLVDFETVYIFSVSERYRSEECGGFLACADMPAQRAEFFGECGRILAGLEFDYAFLCGFAYLLPPEITGRYEGRIINSHHSLLPAHPGLFRKERLAASDDKFLGATLHLVDSGMDTGRKLSQAVFPNYGMERFGEVLKRYRFVQDVMAVQLVRDLSGMEGGDRAVAFEDTLFNPPVERAVIGAFHGR